jgi:hypothetical protein
VNFGLAKRRQQWRRGRHECVRHINDICIGLPYNLSRTVPSRHNRGSLGRLVGFGTGPDIENTQVIHSISGSVGGFGRFFVLEPHISHADYRSSRRASFQTI